MSFQPGERVGDYEILQILGAGGMGRVYKVRNVISDRIEAMKVLLPDLQGDPRLADRFLREIKVQAGLTHPNIAQLHTAMTHGNQLLMLMEFVEGASVEKLLAAEGRLSIDRASGIVIQVLQALAHAHSRGVVHRDIKPANIVVSSDGTVKLLDFGIARMRADRKLTQTGTTVGSLYYMSPEQINGSTGPDPRSDIYSLGITLYEMVTGKKPYEGTSDFSIMAGHLQAQAVAPVEIVPNVPPLLNEIILMALAKKAEQRFQSAEAFRSALVNATSRAPEASPKTMFVAPAAAPPAVLQAPRPAPVMQPPPAVAPPVAAKSNRGLWMAIGSAVGVGVVLFALTQGASLFPKRLDSTPSSSSQAAPAVSDPAPASRNPLVESQPPSRQPGLAAQTETRAESAQRQRTPTPVRQGAALVEQGAAPSSTPSNAPAVQAPAQPVVQESQAPRPAAAKTAVIDEAGLEAQRDRMLKMSARAVAVQAKLKRLASEQAAQGLGMRADFKSAQVRMEQYLDQAEAAIKAGDVAGAKLNLGRADRDVEFLEDKLGI